MISILLEQSYNQINTLFTATYIPSISPIPGSTETKETKYETDKHHTCYTSPPQRKESFMK